MFYVEINYIEIRNTMQAFADIVVVKEKCQETFL